MSNFKKILIIILLTIPFLIGTGLSAWVIINVHENESPPDYNYEAIINNAFNNQQKDYTGNELGPDAMYGGEINTTIIDSKSFTFEYYDGEKWVEGLPTDSGKYNVRVINKYDSNASGIIITFEINKADQRISVENLVVTYDGEEHFIEEDSITIVFGNEEDGSITITGNEPRTNVGTTVVTITVAGNSNFNEYSASVNIEVEPKPISDDDVSVTVVPSYTFDNTEKRPGYSDLEIKYNGMTLTTNDYKITGYANNVYATSDVLATVTIEGINNYTGTRVISFEIAKANQNPSFDTSKTYDGNELVIDVTKDELVTSTPVIKYFDELKNEISAPTNAGTYFIQVTIEGNNNYNNYDSGFVEYIINPRTVSDLIINAVDDIKYTASAITLPKPTVLYGDVTLVENTDYTLKYFNENGDEVTEIIDAGKYTIKVIGTGNFEGEKTLTFKVVKNAISAGSFTIESKVYTGSALEPVVTIVYDGNTLVKDTDFTVDSDEMIDADTYNITINGIGLYEGTVNKDFVIEPANINNVTVSGIDSLVYTGKNITISPIITYNDIVIDNGNYSYNVYQNSIEATIKDAGAYLLKLTGSKNFINSKEVDINVAKLDVSNVEFVAGSVTYNSTNQTPVVTATYDGLELDASNFSVTSSTTEFINANTYELSISGNTNLTGTTTCDYLINKLEISNITALYNTSEYYTNSSIKPEINLTYKEITLEEYTDFTVSYGENIEVGVGAGSIIVTATESSNFKGSHTYYFDIVMQSVVSATITGYHSTISYTGTKYMPDVTVMIGDVTLRKDVDYTVEYGDNVDAGTQTYILVKGIGIYEGEQNIVINIDKATPTISNFSDITINIGESYEVNPVVIGINGEHLDYSLTYKNGESSLQTAPTDIGTYSVILLVNLDNYYVEKTITLKIKSNVTEFTVVMPNLEIEYDGNIKQLTYTGELPEGVTIKGYQYQYDYSSGILSTEGVTDAGSYKVTVQLEYDNTLFELTDDSNLVGMLTITPIKVTMISNIAKDYDSSNRTWALFSETLYELIKFYDVNGNEVTIPDNASGKNFTITGMHNGVYYYGTSVTGLVTTTNVAGSTYLVTVKIDNTNYQITGATTCILKYKTVSVGGTLYTIEDALLLGSGTITTLGNRTGAATYIETVFCNLTKAQKYPYSSYEYVLSGRTLLLPYKDGTTSYYTNLNTAITSTYNVYSALTIPSLVTLNVTNNGNLVVGAGIGSTTDVRDHSVIMNNGEVNIDSGCNVYAYGYIKGTGNLNLKSGSNAIDCLRAYDWPGGSAASSINGKPVFPINAYSCHNISCYTYIYAGAIYKGYLTVSMNIPLIGLKDLETTVIILGAEGTTNESLFNSVNSTGNDYILKYATPALTGASSTALSTIGGSNQVRGQRDVLEIHGEYTDNNLKVSVSGATMETSTTTATPIGYMHIKLCSGSELMINSSDYVFLPGTSLIVEENATLTIGGDVDMSFVTWEELVNSTVPSTTTLISTGNRYFGTYCIDKVDAFLQNNGTVTVSGNIGGIITTTVEGAVLNLASGNVSSTYNSLYYTESPYYYTGTSKAKGITSGLTQTELTASPYISVKSGDTYYWSIADNVNSFNITFMDGDTEVKTIKVYSISDTSYQLTGTEYVHSKLHYDFVHWKTSDGVLAEDILLTVDNNSVTLYAVWEEHEYNFYYTAGYLDSFGVLSDISESADLVFANKITGFTISDFVENVLTITTSATYLEGHFNGWYLGLDDSSGIKISQITLEQLELFISEYGDAKPIPLYCQFTELDTFYVTITDTTLGINLGLTVEEGKTLESYKDQLVFDSSSFDSDESYQYYLNGFKDIEGNAYTLNELLSIPITEDKKISLNWSNKYSVTYKYENDTTKTVYIIPNNTLSLETLDSTTIDKTEYIELYTFAGWTLEGGSNVYTGVIKVEKDITLIPNYQLVKYRYKITITATDATVTINGTPYGSGDHYFDTSSADSRELKLTLSFSTTKDKVEVSGLVSYNGGEQNYSTETTITKNGVLTVNGAECLAEGTLITMADGTKKKVEDILPGDLLIIFNHETGKYETAEVLFNDSESINNYTVVNLEFSNGSNVRVIAEHGFFDLDLMKYVYIDEYNYMDYVGHRFVASTYVDGEVVQSVVTLDNAFLTEEYIRVYSPVTKYHMNYITEDILSMPGGVEGLFNIFEYDDDLQYNDEQMQKDIETYGLFTYEDFKDLVSYEVYCSFPAAYFKVALGKGILTWEDLEYYIARYAPLV